MNGLKKRIEIEALLRWAYRDELPKEHELLAGPDGFGGPWGGVERVGRYGTVIDVSENRFGVVPDFTATTLPHPDAVRVAAVVVALDALELDLPDDWAPLADLGDLGPLGAAAVARGVAGLISTAADGRRRLRTAPRRLIMKHAIMGGTPVWQADIPVQKVECRANGMPRWFRRQVIVTEDGSMEIEVDGFNAKRRMPYGDAYQKPYLDPDPVEAVIGRAEYEVWHAALAVLVEDLNDVRWSEVVDGVRVERVGLRDYEVIHSARPVRPWETGDLAPQQVWQDLTRPTQRLRLHYGSWGIVRPA